MACATTIVVKWKLCTRRGPNSAEFDDFVPGDRKSIQNRSKIWPRKGDRVAAHRGPGEAREGCRASAARLARGPTAAPRRPLEQAGGQGGSCLRMEQPAPQTRRRHELARPWPTMVLRGAKCARGLRCLVEGKAHGNQEWLCRIRVGLTPSAQLRPGAHPSARHAGAAGRLGAAVQPRPPRRAAVRHDGAAALLGTSARSGRAASVGRSMGASWSATHRERARRLRLRPFLTSSLASCLQRFL